MRSTQWSRFSAAAADFPAAAAVSLQRARYRVDLCRRPRGPAGDVDRPAVAQSLSRYRVATVAGRRRSADFSRAPGAEPAIAPPVTDSFCPAARTDRNALGGIDLDYLQGVRTRCRGGDRLRGRAARSDQFGKSCGLARSRRAGSPRRAANAGHGRCCRARLTGRRNRRARPHSAMSPAHRAASVAGRVAGILVRSACLLLRCAALGLLARSRWIRARQIRVERYRCCRQRPTF